MKIDEDEQLIVESAKNGSSRMLEVFAFQVLHKHYPKWNWRVEVDPWGGVMKLQNTSLSSKFGYIIKLRTLTGKNTTRKVVNGGGEILERYAMRRGSTDWLGKYYLPKTDPMGLEVAGGDHSSRIL